MAATHRPGPPSDVLSRSSGRSRAVVLLTLLALALAGLAATGTGNAARAAQRAAAPTVSPAQPMAGERTTFSGPLAGPGRPVVLQKRAGGRWVTVAKGKVTKAKRYKVSYKVARTATFRVTAKPYRGKPGFRSAKKRVKVAGQAATLDLTATPFVLNRSRTVLARVTPVRQGREVVLQRKVGSGSWTNIVVRTTNAAGVAALPYTGTARGNASYRAFARSFRGSTVKGSAAATVATVRATELLSPGAGGSDASYATSVSSDGRWVALDSTAQLLPTDTDDVTDAFLFDRRTGALRHLVPQANSFVSEPRVSANGRFVAFQSQASNLTEIPEQQNDSDVFVLDRTTGDVELVSAQPGTQTPATGTSFVHDISNDGRFVAFTSTATNVVTNGPPNTSYLHAFVRDRSTGTNRGLDRVGLGGWAEHNVYGLDLAGDGSAVVFAGSDPNLDPGFVDGSAIFRWLINPDGSLNATAPNKRVNLTPNWEAGSPTISDDGSVVAFTTDDGITFADSNLVRDVYTTTAPGSYTWLARPSWAAESKNPAISGNGRWVALATEHAVPDDTNGSDRDIVVWDLQTDTFQLVTAAGAGYNDLPLLTRDGSTVVFGSEAPGTVPENEPGQWNSYATVLR